MIELNNAEIQQISGGFSISQILNSTMLGMQVGAPLGALSGAFIGMCTGLTGHGSVLALATLTPAFGLAGYFAGAVATGAAFGAAAIVYNVTVDFTGFLYG